MTGRWADPDWLIIQNENRFRGELFLEKNLEKNLIFFYENFDKNNQL